MWPGDFPPKIARKVPWIQPGSTPLTFAQASASSCSATRPRYFPSFFTF
ncbi:uncharacterized protein G2W53_026494 [Senna tora]|uniref:Uncharacterized protein n=1 Tax=Senna tora TaxID=362788 RepID=A0A834TP30_9FABA|nr:uncharacterized protein G2W53_026494 [Senna tora]